MTHNAPDADHVHTLVLNALVATIADDGGFLADEGSHDTVADVFRAIATPDQRAAFREAVEAVSSGDGPTDEGASRRLEEITNEAVSELGRRDVEATVDHQTRVDLPVRDTRIYTFATTSDASALAALALPSDVQTLVTRGGQYVERDEYEEAVSVFEQAVDDCGSGGEAVTARILAALANHWHGADDRAVDFVEEALHLDRGAWSARLVGLAASHEYPNAFRDGHLGARVFLRYTIDVPTGSAVDPAVGFGETVPQTWTPLVGGGACHPLEMLEPTTWIRLRLRGTLPSFPAVHGYYLGLGIVDLGAGEALDVERILLSGPRTVDSVETLRLSNGASGP